MSAACTDSMMPSMSTTDLMDDIYSLHTERDIEHRKQLQHKELQIMELNKRNEELECRNKQLSHNIALLLVGFVMISYLVNTIRF